jgi:ribosomal protein L29
MAEKTKAILEALNTMSVDQLRLLVDEMSRHIYDYQSQLKISKKNPHLVRFYRKKRARALTIISQKLSSSTI